MNVVVACDHHFERSPDGAIWAHGPLTHSFWERYRPVFDTVRLVARVRDVAEAPEGEMPANGDGVEFIPLPDFTGPKEYLWRKREVGAAMRNVLQNGDAVMLRAPSVVGDCLVTQLRRSGRPFGLEVIADPHDSFGANAVHHPLRLLFRWLFSRKLREQCAWACGLSYVTERALQRRYPPSPGAFATHYSSIDLLQSAFVAAPRPAPTRRPARLLLVGTLAQLYKAPDVLIDAVAEVIRSGVPVELTIVGGGQHLREMEARAAAQGIGGVVHFTGNLATGQAVRAELDRADLFTLPSRQEGLPRAMIEAMARGLPAIGSTVGGIPELLPEDDLVPPNDVPALAAKIREFLGDPERMARTSARNLAKAREYSQEVLTPRRQALYSHVRARTEEWLRKRGGR
jgi:glycosyltransferase involved in cell wall biosynthesis